MAPLSPTWIEALADWTARSADRWWVEAGRPDPFTLAVVSADDGRLAAGVLGAGPVGASALRYVVVNPDVAGRAEPPPDLVRTLPLEDPAFLYPAAPIGGAGGGAIGGGVSFDDEDDPFEERPPARGIGPLVTFINDVPSLGEADGAIVAAGLLSRLEFDLYERREGKWAELRVAAQGDDLVEIAVEAGEEAGVPPVPFIEERARYRRQTGALAWLRQVLPSAARGTLAVVDEWGPGLDLEQLRQIREPIDPQPRPVPGTPWSVVEWRLG